MKIREVIAEKIDTDVLRKGVEHSQKIGKYTYTAKTTSTWRYPLTLVIKCFDGDKKIGIAEFSVKEKDSKDWLESRNTEVAAAYRGQNIAYTMYAYAKMLGNDIHASPYQTHQGKQMWKKWGKDAKNLVKE
jgi:hypothetical protein